MLDSLLSEARRLTGAEAGTIYVREGDELRFAVSHNDVLARRMGAAEARARLAARPLALSERSIASYVALTRATVVIDDVYAIPPSRPYVFNADLDRKNDYRCRSMLVVPLRDARGTVVGVLQLINRLDAAGTVTTFDAECQTRIASLVAERAPAIAPAPPRRRA